jgi:ADP-ribosyl-[dinitrogen reductase] hydrolase
MATWRPPRTSLTDPLRIAEVSAGRGAIGITFCPGKQGDSVFGRPWARDLALDLDVIAGWGAQAVLTLIEPHEMVQLGVPDLGERIRARGIGWHHLPIVDVSPPGAEFESVWLAAGAAGCALLRQGGKVLVHCRGGLGRAGTVAACLLVECGANPREAIRSVRAARPGAIETAAQEHYVRSYVRRFA